MRHLQTVALLLGPMFFIAAAIGHAEKALGNEVGQEADKQKRNIIFILSDDHRWDFFSRENHPWVETPNLDRLAAEGIWFNNAFVTTSVCQSSRNSIITGLYAHALGGMNNWAVYPDNPVRFTELLKDAGYKTAFLGKYGAKEKNEDPKHGFDHWFATTGFGHVDPTVDINGKLTEVKGYIGDILTDQTVQFMEDNKDGPFFLYLAHILVHSPNTPAERHKHLFTEGDIPLPPSYPDTDETYRGKPEWLRKARKSTHGVDGMFSKRTNLDTHYRNYARTVVALDESIGTVMNKLKELGLAENTLVLYMSDNGYLLGEQGLVDKRDMHEPSIRIPLIMRCPELFEAGMESDGFALNIDVAPTLLDVAGVSVPQHMHGRSLLELIEGAEDWRVDFLYEYEWERYRPMTPTVFGLRTHKYSYMRYEGLDDIDELYDMKNDPDQMNNLLGAYAVEHRATEFTNVIEDQGLKEMIRGFQKRMAEIMKETDGDMHPWYGKR